MVTVKGTETKSTHLSASIVKGVILSKWSGDKSEGVQVHIPFKFIFDCFSSVRFWHKAALLPYHRFSYQPQHPEKLRIIARHFPVSSSKHFPLLPIFLLSGLNLSIHNVVYKIHGASSWKFFRQWFSGVGSKTYETGELKRSLPHAFFVWPMV